MSYLNRTSLLGLIYENAADQEDVPMHLGEYSTPSPRELPQYHFFPNTRSPDFTRLNPSEQQRRLRYMNGALHVFRQLGERHGGTVDERASKGGVLHIDFPRDRTGKSIDNFATDINQSHPHLAGASVYNRDGNRGYTRTIQVSHDVLWNAVNNHHNQLANRQRAMAPSRGRRPLVNTKVPVVPEGTPSERAAREARELEAHLERGRTDARKARDRAKRWKAHQERQAPRSPVAAAKRDRKQQRRRERLATIINPETPEGN